MAEEPVNNKTFKDLIAEQKKTTIAIEKSMMDDEQRASFEALEREKFQKSSEANKRGAETKRLNALKSQDPNSAAGKETKKESNSYLRDTFKTFLGKGSELAKGLGSIGEGLKAKVKSGLSGIMDAIKTGAFIAFLGAVSAFLKSDLFKDMKDKYLPVIADGVKSLFDTLKGIVDGFFDEDGNFSAAAGFKNIFDELSTAFTNFGTNLKESFLDENGDLTLKSAIAGIPDAFGVLLGAFINPVTGLLAILAPKKFFGAAVWVGKKLFGNALRLARGGFGKLFTSIGLFSDELGTTASNMDGDVSKSKKTGAFRRGLQGTGGKFRRLFRVLGKFGGLLGGVGLTMLSFLDPSSLGKVFTTVGDSFKSLFGAVKDFGSKVTNSAFKMGQNVIDASKTGVFSIANGIGTGFTKLFNKVSSFGTSVSNTVSGMGEAIKNSNAFSTVSAKFSGFFGKVGDFGTKVADRAKILGESVTNSSVFKALSTTFDSLFGVVTNFGKEIGKVASAAAGATADAVKAALKSVASIGAKKPPKPVKLTRSMMDAIAGRGEFKPKIKPSSIGSPKVQTTSPNLGGSGTGDASLKVSSAVDAPTIKTKPPNLTTFNTTSPKIPMMDLKSSKITPTSNKLSKQVTEEVLSRSIAKNAAKLALKSVIVVGAVTSGYFALSKLLKGDYVGAAMEGGDIFAPSLVGLPLSTATTIRDIYNESYGTDSNKFPFDKDLVNNPTETNKRLGVIKDQLMKQLGMNKSKKKPPAKIKPQETSSDTIDFSKIKKFSDYQKVQGQLRINPNYDADGSGIYSKKEFRVAKGAAKLEGSGSPVYEGPMFLQPTRIVTNNQQSVVISRPITDTSFGGIMSSR